MQLGIGYTVTTDCLMIHRIVKLEKEYTSIVKVYKYYKYKGDK